MDKNDIFLAEHARINKCFSAYAFNFINGIQLFFFLLEETGSVLKVFFFMTLCMKSQLENGCSFPTPFSTINFDFGGEKHPLFIIDNWLENKLG